MTIPKGSRIILLLAAASRDPDLFANPDQFDPDRPKHRALRPRRWHPLLLRCPAGASGRAARTDCHRPRAGEPEAARRSAAVPAEPRVARPDPPTRLDRRDLRLALDRARPHLGAELLKAASGRGHSRIRERARPDRRTRASAPRSSRRPSGARTRRVRRSSTVARRVAGRAGACRLGTVAFRRRATSVQRASAAPRRDLARSPGAMTSPPPMITT